MSGEPMDTAPRNGLTIIVGDPDVGEFLMHWDDAAENGLFPGKRGFWVSSVGGFGMAPGGFTWGEHDDFGPTYWRPMEAAAHPKDQSHG